MTEDAESMSQISDLVWKWTLRREGMSIKDIIWLLDALCAEWTIDRVREDKERNTGMCLRCGRYRKGP